MKKTVVIFAILVLLLPTVISGQTCKNKPDQFISRYTGSEAGLLTPGYRTHDRNYNVTQVCHDVYLEDWIPSSRWQIEYNDAEYPINVNIQEWNDTTSVYYDSFWYDLSYDDAGRPLAVEGINLVDGAEHTFELMSYEYEEGRISRIVRNFYDLGPDFTRWEKLYTFDSESDNLVSVLYNFYDENFTIENSDRLDYTYDDSGRPAEVIRYIRSGGGTWQASSRNTYIWHPDDETTQADHIYSSMMEWLPYSPSFPWGFDFKIISNTRATAYISGTSWVDLYRYLYNYENGVPTSCRYQDSTPSGWVDNMLTLYNLDEATNVLRETVFNLVDGQNVPSYRFVSEYTGHVPLSDSTAPSVTSVKLFPNPIRENCQLRLSLSKDEQIMISLFNIRGQKVKSISNRSLPAGEHQIKIDSEALKGLNQGVYLIRIEAAGSTPQTIKTLLIK